MLNQEKILNISLKIQLKNFFKNNNKLLILLEESPSEVVSDYNLKKLNSLISKVDKDTICILTTSANIQKFFNNKYLVIDKEINKQASNLLISLSNTVISNIDISSSIRTNYIRLDDFLSQKEILSLDLLKSKQSKTIPENNSENIIALIADNTKESSLIRLIFELTGCENNNIKFNILQIGDKTLNQLEKLQGILNLEIFKLEQILDKDELSRFSKYPKREQAFRAKPKFIKYLLELNNRFFIYSDLDIIFFNSPFELKNEFNEGLLLFPQYNDNKNINRLFGHYQAGLIGIKPGAEKFLQKWDKICSKHFSENYKESYFTDQGILDLSHILDPQINVYRNADHNLAEWNKQTFGLETSLDETELGYRITNFKNENVKSFHASENANDSLRIVEKRLAYELAIEFLTSEQIEQANLDVFEFYSARHNQDKKHIANFINAISTFVFIKITTKSKLLNVFSKSDIICHFLNKTLGAISTTKIYKKIFTEKEQDFAKTQRKILEN